MIGTIDIIFDILRTVWTLIGDLSNFPDANIFWAFCEPTVAVMVCALPSYRELLSKRPQHYKRSESVPYRSSNGKRMLQDSVILAETSISSVHGDREVSQDLA